MGDLPYASATPDEPDAAPVADPVSRLILDEAGDLGGVVLVVDDRHGSLSAAALATGARVLAACDDARDEAELPDGVEVVDLYAPADLSAVTTVLWRLPKAVAAIEDVAEQLALRCAPGVRVTSGARDRHLVPAMTDALRACFADVSASRGRQKSRALRAAGPTATVRTWPRLTSLPELGLTVATHGGVFAGGRLDLGTRLLLRAVRHDRPVGGRVLDLGCGTGVVAAVLAADGWDVVATDVSAAAVASTRRTLQENGLDAQVTRAAGIATDAGDLDLVVCNPPFHRGTEKDSSAAFELIADAGRQVRPGGQVWLVYNAHLPYLSAAFDHIGPTRVVVRDRAYLVTCSTRR